MEDLSLSSFYIDAIIEQSEGGTYDDVVSDEVPHGYVLEVYHLSVENQTTNYTRLLIGCRRSRSFIQHEAEEAPVADQLFWNDNRFHIPEGYRACARMYGCTAGDILAMTIAGIFRKVAN